MQILRATAAFVVLIVAAFNSGKLLGMIRLSDVMSQDEQKKTGVSQMSVQQKQELERWINDKFVLKTANADTSTLSLQQNLQNGSQLVLSDGSVYAIAPTDQSKTSFWLTPVPLKLSASSDPAFPVLLTNTITGVSVRAKQVRAAIPSTQAPQ